MLSATNVFFAFSVLCVFYATFVGSQRVARARSARKILLELHKHEICEPGGEAVSYARHYEFYTSSICRDIPEHHSLEYPNTLIIIHLTNSLVALVTLNSE